MTPFINAHVCTCACIGILVLTKVFVQSKEHEDTSTQVTGFLDDWFFYDFKKFFPIHSPLIPKVSSTQVTAFLAKWVLRIKKKIKHTYNNSFLFSLKYGITHFLNKHVSP